VDDFGVSFPLLSDEGNRVARQYGLVYSFPDDLRRVHLDVFDVDLAEFNGDDSWTLPMPARYVVDGDGVIRWASVSPDHADRPDPADTVEALRDVLT
jgi:peroxiredoxin